MIQDGRGAMPWPLRVLGVDPSSVEGAYCLIEHRGTRARWLASGMFACTPKGAREVLEAHPASLVVVERPAWIPIPGNFDGRPLVDTAWQGGGFFYLAEGLGRTTRAMLVRDWRGFLCGRQRGGGTAGDKDVKAAVQARFDDVPVRTSNHVRDAAGVAFVGGLHFIHEQRGTSPRQSTTPDRASQALATVRTKPMAPSERPALRGEARARS